MNGCLSRGPQELRVLLGHDAGLLLDPAGVDLPDEVVLHHGLLVHADLS